MAVKLVRHIHRNPLRATRMADHRILSMEKKTRLTASEHVAIKPTVKGKCRWFLKASQTLFVISQRQSSLDRPSQHRRTQMLNIDRVFFEDKTWNVQQWSSPLPDPDILLHFTTWRKKHPQMKHQQLQISSCCNWSDRFGIATGSRFSRRCLQRIPNINSGPGDCRTADLLRAPKMWLNRGTCMQCCAKVLGRCEKMQQTKNAIGPKCIVQQDNEPKHSQSH